MITRIVKTIQTGFRFPAQPECSTNSGERGHASFLQKAICLVPLLLFGLAGCVQAPSSLAMIPATGPGITGPADGKLEVREYALVEQSEDNPTHLSFQERVPASVADERQGWHFPGAENAVDRPNQLLAPFGFQLRPNQSPPFSGYSLYHHDTPLQTDIASFWPVSLKHDSSQQSTDFLLPFMTLAGEKRVASAAGVFPWPASAQAGSGSSGGAENDPPVYYGRELAYAQTSDGTISVYAGPSLLYSESEPEPQAALPGSTRELITWGDEKTGQHWALQMDQRVVVDGQDLRFGHSAERVYEFHILDGQAFYFYDKDGQTYLNYNGRDLPYSYDRVIHQNSGELSVFNPGSSGNIVWFYALRDGLWYYVEVGKYP